MTTLWSATCRDDADDVAVTIRVEAAESTGYDLHIHFPPPSRRPRLGPHDVLFRALTWSEVLTWFDRYRARHRLAQRRSRRASRLAGRLRHVTRGEAAPALAVAT